MKAQTIKAGVSVLAPKGPPFTVARYGSLGASICAERDALRGALEALYALVQGEAPSLLEDNHHDQIVRDALGLCDHDWKWVSGWYGDPNVINGIADCSGWECTKCGSTDCDDDPPSDEDDPDELRDRMIDRERDE